MILDKIVNIKNYLGITRNMDTAINYMVNKCFANLETGRHEIDGDSVFLLIQEYETKRIDEGKLESHRKYIDIQYVIEGSELIGYAPIEDLKVVKEYDGDDDFMLFEGAFETHRIENGRFAVYFPHDGHMPTINDCKKKVKKAVFKIQI
jgi:YhcH/YjgK/YiaL family protein